MGIDAAMRRLELVRKSVDLVLGRYTAERGCPCDYRQFVYWAGKNQGPGWHDTVQNFLVKATLELDCFEKTDCQSGKWGYEGSWFCRNCGALWSHISLEWRMLAFHERLFRLGEEDPDSLYDGMISMDVAATVGHEPNGLKRLSLEQWVEFMLDRNDSPEKWD
ncbi:MAG: hypothetical protein AVO35_04650 [Candidatus Aegiribacteria sp. MLS_C]|nr:MAG: hypothetical protein AVO35_04650 [Candidatus Aegiribacteria sp. MLS_C]